MYTLFRIAAFFSLTELVTALAPAHPHALYVLLPYYLLMGFGILNYFGSIVVYLFWEYSIEGMKDRQHEAADESPATEVILQTIVGLRDE